MPGFRLVLFTNLQPFEAYRLLDRPEREVPGIEIAGLLYEVRPPKPLSAQVRDAIHRLGEPGFLAYAIHRVFASFLSLGEKIARALLRLAQASSVRPSPRVPGSPDELANHCRKRGWEVLLASNLQAEECLHFVRGLRADLGIAMGTDLLAPALCKIPRLGSVSVQTQDLPENRSGGPPGLRELLNGQSEFALQVHQVEETAGAGRILRKQAVRIDAFDNLTSLALKAGIVSEDLLMDTLRDFIRGTLAPQPHAGSETTLPSPAPHELYLYKKKLATLRPTYKAPCGRPAWKLLLRSSAYLWLIPIRNWKRRATRKFPLVILFHHLISDRPHPMALSTEGFLKHLRYLKRHYRLVSLAEGLRLLASRRIEEPTAVLTFDDGYEETFVNLRAVLRAEPAPVTMFVCPELSEKRQAFPHDVRDSREGFPPFTPAQVRQLAAEGMEIGSHTRTHFDCRSTDPTRLEGEIAGSRRDLETLLGRPVTMFSFPWGKPVNMSVPAVKLAETNYERYFSAYGGANFPGTPVRHLLRTGHELDLWELELALQQLLEFQPTGYHQVSPAPAEPGNGHSVPTGGESGSTISVSGQTR